MPLMINDVAAFYLGRNHFLPQSFHANQRSNTGLLGESDRSVAPVLLGNQQTHASTFPNEALNCDVTD